MSRKLFVGGLAWGTTTEGFEQAFASFGELTSAKVITDRETGRSRGFGFVEFVNETDAQTALTAMNGSTLEGRTIRVEFSVENQRDNRRGRTPTNNDNSVPLDDNYYNRNDYHNKNRFAGPDESDNFRQGNRGGRGYRQSNRLHRGASARQGSHQETPDGDNFGNR